MKSFVSYPLLKQGRGIRSSSWPSTHLDGEAVRALESHHRIAHQIGRYHSRRSEKAKVRFLLLSRNEPYDFRIWNSLVQHVGTHLIMNDFRAH
jgi:hypothetical protein